MRRALTTACLTLAVGLLFGLPASAHAADTEHRIQYKVLVYTKAAGATHASTAAGVEAIKALGKEHRFVVQATDKPDRFNDDDLASYRVVVFLNTAGDVLDDAQQAAFERWFKAGGGFLGVHSAIETEPDWQFLSDLLGTRAAGEAPLAQATIKVADRVHDASRTLPERWSRSDRFYNFAANVRGRFHVLATVDETTYAGGTMGVDHPVAWCKDTQGGRAFYTAGGDTAATFSEANFREHLLGALDWSAGIADPVYSDCGATVLANYQQVKISAPPNLNEPIGFDQLPDGRLIQTTRDGRVRLHDPETGTTDVIANVPVYTVNEDGLYGPAVDNDFADNKWVYLFYSPVQMEGVSQSGTPYPATTPLGAAPTTAPDPSAWDQWKGYFQLSRFKFVDRVGSEPARLDMASEQKIMKVEMDRGACCHVAGDIDFDKHNNLWMVTGDDTPATAVGANNYPPFNDYKTNESQVVRVAGANGGAFTISWEGETTAPIPFNANAAAIQAALEGLAAVEPGDVLVSGNGNVSTANQTIQFRGRYSQQDVSQSTADGAALTGTGPPAVTLTTSQQGDWFAAPFNDARRGSLNTNDLRGKVLRIKVKTDGSYEVPAGNMFPESDDAGNKTRPEIYAMGFRNPFRIQVDSDGVAYVTDYSPDANAPGAFRAAAGTGRIEIVRKPSNYGWPVCYSTDLPMYKWDFNLQQTLGETFECGNPSHGPENTSRWNTGMTVTPPITRPDVWYSFRDDLWGTPCLDGYNRTPVQACPRLFPELGQGGVGPHGATKYEFDPDNPSETKFPPYYDGAVFFAEWTRDYLKEIRLDSEGKVLKINDLLNCGAALVTTAFPFECDNPMDQQFGADGNYYLLTYGDGFNTANPDAGLYRFEYVAGPQRPRAVMSADPSSGVGPLSVQFSSAGSRDPDEGDSIRFEWDFDGNGTVDSIDPSPTHTYTANGVYTAKLTVTDAGGRSDSKTIPITVGNTAPKVTIDTPVDGDFFEWGQSIPFSVAVVDAEDGAIDCSRVEVSLVLVHDSHGHGESTVNACSGTLPTSADLAFHGGYLAAGISVTYTDEGGGGQPALSTTAQHVVQTRRQQPEFSQEARGLTFPAVNAVESDPGGGQVAASIDNGDYLGLNNRYFFGNMSQEITFRFAQASAAGAPRGIVDVRTDSPTGDVVASCTLAATGGANTYTNQTCAFTTPVTGSRKLYLSFRQAAGGPATNFGNLNWVQFSGAGIGR